jgi:hypothetical protein
MTPLVEFCIVVVTVALVANTIAAIRAMKRAEDALTRATRAIDHIEAVTQQVQEVVASAQTAMQPVLRATTRFEEVAERATRTSHAVLNEIDPPLRTTLAVLAGVKQGARFLIGRLQRRMHHDEHVNGGE